MSKRKVAKQRFCELMALNLKKQTSQAVSEDFETQASLQDQNIWMLSGEKTE